MNKRNDWEEFKKLLEQHNITKLYHFTDRDNLENIIKNGGLYSWKDCEERGIDIPSQAVAEQVHCRGRSTSRQDWSITFASASHAITL